MRSLAEALRAEVREHGVKVTAVYPGITMTSCFDPSNPAALPPPIPLEQMPTPADVAQATLAALGLPDRVSIDAVVVRPTGQER